MRRKFNVGDFVTINAKGFKLIKDLPNALEIYNQKTKVQIVEYVNRYDYNPYKVCINNKYIYFKSDELDKIELKGDISIDTKVKNKQNYLDLSRKLQKLKVNNEELEELKKQNDSEILEIENKLKFLRDFGLGSFDDKQYRGITKITGFISKINFISNPNQRMSLYNELIKHCKQIKIE